MAGSQRNLSNPILSSMSLSVHTRVLLSILIGTTVASSEPIRVRTLSLGAKEMPVVHLKTAKGHQALRFSTVQPTQAVTATYANPLPLYKSELDEAGNKVFVIDQTVKVPVGAKGILLLGWKTGEKTQYVAIKDDLSTTRYNDWLLINTTRTPILFQVGEKAKPIKIAPGGSETYKITTEKNKGASVIAQAPREGVVKIFYSTYWPVHANKRAIVLFINDGSKIRVKRISDKLSPPAS